MARVEEEGAAYGLAGALFLPVEVERPLELTGQTVTRLLKKPVSSGYVEADRWCFSVRKGHHEGLISFRTHQQIQDRLEGRKRRPAAALISMKTFHSVGLSHAIAAAPS